jgi:DNA-binding Lrp family transcriptional regulator
VVRNIVLENIIKIAKLLSEVTRIDETDMSILLLWLANSKLSKDEIARLLGFKDGNSVSYHTNRMQKEGVIGRYSIVPDWKQMGLGTEFVVLAEAENEERLLEIEQKHIAMVSEYASKVGDIAVIRTITGCVVLENIYHCFGDKTMAIIVGRATSDRDAAFYCKNYIAKEYPNIKINLLINKYKTINNFIIDTHTIKKVEEVFHAENTIQTSGIFNDLSKFPVP